MHQLSPELLLIDYLRTLLGSRYVVKEIPLRQQLFNVEMYCKSNGMFHDMLHRLRYQPIIPLIDKIVYSSSSLSLSTRHFWDIISSLHNDGYAFLSECISADTIESILSSTSTMDRYGVDSSGNFRDGDQLIPVTERYNETELMCIPEIRELYEDPVLKSVAAIYLRTEVKLRDLSMWFTNPSNNPSSESAQMFHFDLDELRWLKVFVYLSNVEPESGPHVYIPGTHKPGSKHKDLLNKGYSRIGDNEMRKYHDQSTWKSICLPKGSIIFADTRCWHKGKFVTRGTRGMLSIEYAPSYFSKVISQGRADV